MACCADHPIRCGSPCSSDALRRRYYPELKAAAERLVPDPRLAENMAERAFQRAAERAHLAGEASQRRYMHAVLQHLRDRSRATGARERAAAGRRPSGISDSRLFTRPPDDDVGSRMRRRARKAGSAPDRASRGSFSALD